MEDPKYDLIDIIRDPGRWIYEAQELTHVGHYYIFRYDSAEGAFHRATVPTGAGAVQFRRLGPTEKVPIGGWVKVERNAPPRIRLRLVDTPKTPK